VIGGVNTYHLSATRRGLVVFPRFASVCRTAAAGGGGGGGALRPTVFLLRGHSPKTDPQSPDFFEESRVKTSAGRVFSQRAELEHEFRSSINFLMFNSVQKNPSLHF
jgi:hypothetical protein